MRILGKYPKGYHGPIRVNARCRPGMYIVIGHIGYVYVVVATEHERGRTIQLHRPIDHSTKFNETIMYTIGPPADA